MALSLDQWQERLEGHFARLSAARSSTDFPLFALEHGLTGEEVEEIAALLHKRLAEPAASLGRHWLVWVVYATEQGYNYDGGEYWDSYESCTPQWRQSPTSARRNRLRSWFQKFHETYRGLKPSGPWAKRFSIISWPITHAVLPVYLQTQLAKKLYELRHRLANLNNLDANAVGDLLANNAWDASSRFLEFLQQQELAGRIVLAFLSDKGIEDTSPIHTPTLARLVSDLEEVQQAREWLRGTKQLVSDRLKGAGHIASGLRVPRDAHDSATLPAPASPRLRPALMLRRTSPSGWSIVVGIPGLAVLAASNPPLRKLLQGTRCKIRGSGDTWLPRSWLLSGSSRRTLRLWPGATAPLVHFEQTNSVFDQLAGPETRLTSGPVWLCRVGRDGIAREVIGRTARPGQRYVVLSETEIASTHELLSPCQVECAGIQAATLSVPESISSEVAGRLLSLGIQVARTVRIWPAGLPARRFDGEGYSEWLTTEAPSFGLVHDHSVDTFLLRLNDEAEVEVKAEVAGSPVFVRCEPLQAGTHTLSIRATRRAGPELLGTSFATGVIALHVREPDPWMPGTTSHSGLAVSLDSPDPDLDGLWNGSVGLSVLGPSGHQVSCFLTLQTANGDELMSEEVGNFDLPLSPSGWFAKFSTFTRDEIRVWHYLQASTGWLSISNDELGEYKIRLDRHVNPVRWLCRDIQKTMTTRLVDDTGLDSEPTCQVFSFSSPAEPISLPSEHCTTGFAVTAPGGVLEARHGEFVDSVVVSLPPGGHNFGDLMFEPDLAKFRDDATSLLPVLDALAIWTHSRGIGPLVDLRRKRIVERLAAMLYFRLGGSRWEQAESAFLDSPTSFHSQQSLERAVGARSGFVAAVKRDNQSLEESTDSGSQWFARIAADYGISADPGLCKFALQLASRPHELTRLPHLPRHLLETLLGDLKSNGTLLRSARLIALFSAAREPSAIGPMFPRWRW